MSIKTVDVDEIVSKIKEKDYLYYIPKNSVRYVRFVGDFKSFIGIQLHKKFIESDKKYDIKLCYSENCPYCQKDEPVQDLFLPIYECDSNGGIINNRKERLWHLPYNSIYRNIENGNPLIKDNIKNFYIKIQRDERGKYEFDFKYIIPAYNNLDNNLKVRTKEDWCNFIVSIYGDDLMKENLKKENRRARVVDEDLKGIDPPTVSPVPTNSDPVMKHITGKGKGKQF